MKIKIEDTEIDGKMVEHSKSEDVEFFYIDLETKVRIDPDSAYPSVKILMKDGWTDAKIDRVPSSPNYNRIVISITK